ncbi:hypothetical protein C7M61_004658 [Candidozyma pseudohaemuli]|uniref:PCI domain-containing protein n=1 Tax=Candidozyma pseudohaemuli TaxID=418784 RepID=A0A2P7YHI1_9ASCO|nr:hypothetical protein C7M61_004658 [[Candida] pseudohaemulonii]PSK35411.1 hypothetical protein C7M61_004658 [[Candida] pseudohaemulonii]
MSVEEIVTALAKPGEYSYRATLEAASTWPSAEAELLKAINTLELFAYGNYGSFLRHQGQFLDLLGQLTKKLVQLTLISACNENEGRLVTFETLLKEYSLEQALEGKEENLELLIMEMIDENVLVAKIDERLRSVKFVDSLVLRDAFNERKYALRVLDQEDVRKRSVSEAKAFLQHWLDTKVIPAQAELQDA